jgi:hypothetical protein
MKLGIVIFKGSLMKREQAEKLHRGRAKRVHSWLEVGTLEACTRMGSNCSVIVKRCNNVPVCVVD